MDYTHAVEYLNSFINYEKERDFQYPEDLKLDRMKLLVRQLANPQNSYECVTIAGSKGKGSTAAILASILRMENYRVGFYTSPHLLDLRERIQVNGLLISESRFTDGIERLRKILDQPQWRRERPTYFEILTALAFCHFKEMKIHVAVLEVGLGGLYDSTNVANPKVVGITPISLEHTDKLGKTVSKIAVQKCGIIKGRQIVVTAPQSSEAQTVIENAADARESELIRVGKDIKVTEREVGEDYQRFDLRGIYGNIYDLELRLRGRHQLDNAAVAFGLAKSLERKTRLRISEEAIRQGLIDARWPGRLEKISERIKIVLDGAHNAQSARRMIEGLKRHFKYSDLIVILGTSQDKDVNGILREVLPESGCLIATQSSHPRALSAREIARQAQMLDDEKEIFVEENIKKAIEKAKFLSDSSDVILVTGSLFLVADIKKLVGRIL